MKLFGTVLRLLFSLKEIETARSGFATSRRFCATLQIATGWEWSMLLQPSFLAGFEPRRYLWFLRGHCVIWPRPLSVTAYGS